MKILNICTSLFFEVETKITDLKNLQGPLYDGINREHGYFGDIERNMAYLRSIANPLLEIEREHHFLDFGRQMESLKQMNYPIREGVNYSNKFNEVQEKVVTIKNLTGPVLDIEASKAAGN